MLAILLVLILFWASIEDLRSREIPDELSLALVLIGLGSAVCGLHPLPTATVLLGALLGFGVGALFFALGAMGGGDAKLLAGAGAILGWMGWIPFFALSSVAGGALALVGRARGWEEIPYAPAFLAGCLGTFVLAGMA